MHTSMIMKSWGTKGKTTYHEGVFHIGKDDTLLVKIPNNGTRIKMDHNATFFGAFLLHAD